MASKLFPSLAAPVFAAMLFIFSLKRRSREINGGGANNNAAANDGTAGGDSGTHTSTEVPEVATSSGANKDAAANDGTAGGDSGTHTSTEVPEMPASSGYDYEVFLSFRGPDTRSAFTDFLYTSLDGAGIRTFKDDESLRVGEQFEPKLLQAINQSKILIPIFSKDYASSVWCLKELVQMVECEKTGRQKIMPIFYDVAPSEVRHQTGGYGEALRAHEKKGRYGKEIISQWKAALSAVLAINGWDLHSKKENRREGEFAKELTRKVFSELKKGYLAVSNCLVHVDNHVDTIMEKIGAGTSETRIIGIHGMGGIGKTTIAKMIYNKLLHDFENCCFLRDIREVSERNGIHCLQNQLISGILKMKGMDIKDIDEGTRTIKERLSNKRVLLLLDDVHEKNHADALVGERDWFGKGSKLIITTRNKEVLDVLKVDDCYELMGMDRDQSLQLFSKHAFRRDSPLDEYIDQSNKVIGIAKGLPLALEIIGSLLSCTEKKKWNDILEKLENVPHKEVQRKLKISYDALELRHKHIFLDIACLFIGYNKDVTVHFWEKSKFFPKVAMDVLQNMSLIKIEQHDRMWMHDQLRDLGREIVRQESNMKIEKQSRVWDPKEGLDLLKKPKGKTEVEALRLKLDNQQQYRFTYESFESLSKLRFLEVESWTNNLHLEESLIWHELTSNVPPANENSYLLPQLHWLSWRGIPATFNITNFSMEDVVFLDLSGRDITDDWQGWRHMEVMKNLKVMDLSYCQHVKRTPNFSAHSNLERLMLSSCPSLTEIDGSVCHLKSLVSLDVSNCEKLQRLPDELGGDLASLEYLSLKHCKSLERLPDTIGNLKSLIELDISYCQRLKRTPNFSAHSNLKRLILSGCESLTEIDRSICHLKSLVSLDVSDCEKLQRLPDELGGDLASLEYLSLNRSKSLERLPDTIGNLESLIELDISLTMIKELPDSIGKLKNLKVVKMGYVGITKIPDALWTIEKLEEIHADMRRYDKPSCHVNIGNCISRNQSMRILRLAGANIYTLPPRLPESLMELALADLYMDTFPDLSNLTNLKKLDLNFGERDSDGKSYGPVEDQVPRWMGNLSKLKSLALRFDCETASPTDLSLPPQLKSLDLECGITTLPTGLPPQLESLHLKCGITTLPTSLPPQLKSLYLSTPKLRHLPSLPPSLSSLRLEHCYSLCSMEDLSNLKNLSSLGISGTAIAEIPGLGCLEGLRHMTLQCLEQVKVLPDLSNLNKLRSLYVWDCSDLVEIQGELPQSLEKLVISSCKSLQKLPDLSSLMGKKVAIIHCGKLNVEAILVYARMQPRDLSLAGFDQLQILPDLSNSNDLRSLYVSCCDNLVEIQGELPQSLEKLRIDDCESLQKLPDLSSLKGLRKVCISHCGSLAEIHGELPQSLEKLKIDTCKSLHELPNLSSLMGRRKVEINRCKKLDVEAIASLCSKKVEFLVENDESESESESEGDDAESESEDEGDDAKSESEDEGEDNESKSKGEDEE